eukprot:4876234-Amphidinium_carterae.1
MGDPMVEIGAKAQPGLIDTGGDPGEGDPIVENCLKAQFDTGGDPGGTPAELMILNGSDRESKLAGRTGVSSKHNE